MKYQTKDERHNGAKLVLPQLPSDVVDAVSSVLADAICAQFLDEPSDGEQIPPRESALSSRMMVEYDAAGRRAKARNSKVRTQ